MDTRKKLKIVVAEISALLAKLRADGHSDTEILMSVVIALNAAPVARAVEESPEVADFLKKAGAVYERGKELLADARGLLAATQKSEK